MRSPFKPQDGFIPPGNHVWQNNNLAQKNLSIVYPDDSSQEGDNVFAGIIGGFERRTKFHGLEIKIKWPIPKSATAYIRFVNEHVERFIHEQIKKKLIKDLKPATVKDQTVFFLSLKAVIKFQIPNVGPFPILIGTNVKKLAQKDSMIVDVFQFNDSGKPTGGLTFQLSGKGLKPK